MNGPMELNGMGDAPQAVPTAAEFGGGQIHATVATGATPQQAAPTVAFFGWGLMLSLTRHQWAVLLAAWLGWGFVRGTLMAVIVLITWWSCNAFIPSIATGLAQTAAQETGLDRGATLALVESWKTDATAWFNLGGLVGTLLTIPVAKHLGRKPMFAAYLALSATSIFAAFGPCSACSAASRSTCPNSSRPACAASDRWSWAPSRREEWTTRCRRSHSSRWCRPLAD